MVWHHVLVIIGSATGLLLSSTLAIHVISLTCEINTVFLHLRKLLFMAHFLMRSSRVYRCIWALIWITLPTTRVFVHMYCVYGIYAARAQFEGAIEYMFWATSIGYIVLVVLDGDVSIFITTVGILTTSS
jgi:hypothetical protein